MKKISLTLSMKKYFDKNRRHKVAVACRQVSITVIVGVPPIVSVVLSLSKLMFGTAAGLEKSRKKARQ